MSNQEPPSPILRLRDVLAWMPQLNIQILQAMEEVAELEGDPISCKPTPNSRRFYLKEPLKRRLHLTS